MEFTMEWNVICRVCLQEGEMHSVFENDEDALISEKIMQCSNIKIERGVNLPENICSKCLEELRTAYTFRSNCESSDAVLQSFVKGNIVNDLVISSNGEVYKYKPPQGLKVKRIPKPIKEEMIVEELKQEFTTSSNVSEVESLDDDHVDVLPSPPREHKTSLYEFCSKSENDDTSSQVSEQNDMIAGKDFVVIDDGSSLYTMKINEEDEEDNGEHIITYNETDGLIKSIDGKFKRKLPPLTQKPRSGPQEIKIPRQRGKGEKPMHICEICGNSYKHRHSLETHMRRHRNEKPFSCEICGRAFVLNVELKCHMRTHTGQKPYPCRFCGRRFSDFGSRIKHERTHTGERPYACETCGKAFAYSYGLTSHMLTHTGEKPFECEKCGKRFAKKHHLKNHLNTHAKQENRIRTKGIFIHPNVVANTSNSGVGSSEDEYSSVLTVLTNDENTEQCIGQYIDVDIVELKEENSAADATMSS